jgi:hypothetical protein
VPGPDPPVPDVEPPVPDVEPPVPAGDPAVPVVVLPPFPVVPATPLPDPPFPVVPALPLLLPPVPGDPVPAVPVLSPPAGPQALSAAAIATAHMVVGIDDRSFGATGGRTMVFSLASARGPSQVPVWSTFRRMRQK